MSWAANRIILLFTFADSFISLEECSHRGAEEEVWGYGKLCSACQVKLSILTYFSRKYQIFIRRNNEILLFSYVVNMRRIVVLFRVSICCQEIVFRGFSIR